MMKIRKNYLFVVVSLIFVAIFAFAVFCKDNGQEGGENKQNQSKIEKLITDSGKNALEAGRDKLLDRKKTVTYQNVVTGIDRVNEIVSVISTYSGTQTFETKNRFFTEKSVEIEYEGRLKYGYNLSVITDTDVTIDGHIVTINVPATKLISNEINFKIKNEKDTFITRNKQKDLPAKIEQIKKYHEEAASKRQPVDEFAANNLKIALEAFLKTIDPEIEIYIIR